MTTIFYVIRAEPTRDAQVAQDLTQQGYDAVLSWTFERALVNGKNAVVTRLRLSPYLFVGVDYNKHDFRPVRETLHVADYLSFGPERRPSSVPESVITGIRQDEIEDYEMAVRRVRRKPPSFGEGDVVKVVSGPFEGHQGKVSDPRQSAAMVEINGWPMRIAYAQLSLVKAAARVA